MIVVSAPMAFAASMLTRPMGPVGGEREGEQDGIGTGAVRRITGTSDQHFRSNGYARATTSVNAHAQWLAESTLFVRDMIG